MEPCKVWMHGMNACAAFKKNSLTELGGVISAKLDLMPVVSAGRATAAALSLYYFLCCT